MDKLEFALWVVVLGVTISLLGNLLWEFIPKGDEDMLLTLGAILIGICLLLIVFRHASKSQENRSTDSRSMQAPSVSSLRVVDIEDVLMWGWNGRRLLDELIRLDYRTIEGLTSAHEGQTEQWVPVFMDHPDTWRLVIDSHGEIVGYWHFVPLFDDEYQLARTGQLFESAITTDKVKFFELPGKYNAYFVSICMQARYRRTPAMRIIFDSLLDTFTELAREGVFISELCANAYSASGVALSQSLGFTYACDHIDHGKIFTSNFRAVLSLDFAKRHRELIHLYSNL
ncbi:hypothetical protein KKC97_10870 [bacterium]|nr:hypothetical protein [bacterium]